MNAAYFMLVAAGALRPDAPFIPQVCRMDGATCAAIIHTPQARLFGIPNSVLGVGAYPVLAWAHFAGWPAALHVAFVVSAAAAATSAYLVYALRVQLRARCPLCFLAHGINAALLVLTAMRWVGSAVSS